MNKKTKETYLKIYKSVSQIEDLMTSLDAVEMLEATNFVFKYLENRKKYAEHLAFKHFI